MKNKAGQKFPLEFKLEAIKLVKEQGYSQSAAGRALGFNGKNINRRSERGWQGSSAGRLTIVTIMQRQRASSSR